MTGVLPLSPNAVAEWMPFCKAAGFFFATFVLEDAAAIGAGLLLAAGQISWPAAFTACFLGIWLGDAGLYALARFAGRAWFERSSLRRFSAQVARSEKWFAERGTPILIFSRARSRRAPADVSGRRVFARAAACASCSSPARLPWSGPSSFCFSPKRLATGSPMAGRLPTRRLVSAGRRIGPAGHAPTGPAGVFGF